MLGLVYTATLPWDLAGPVLLDCRMRVEHEEGPKGALEPLTKAFKAFEGLAGV